MAPEILLHFLKFDIQTEDLDIDPWIKELYTENDLTDVFSEQASRLRLHLNVRNSRNSFRFLPASNATFAETNLCGGPCFYHDGRFFSSSCGEYCFEMEYELETGEIRANLGGKYLASGQAVISNLIRPLLQSFILPFHNLKSLHGALVTKDGQTIFLSGPGGEGKTTVAVQLAEAGYSLLSDDGPLFTLHQSKAFALSSLDYLHLTERTLELFPQLRRLTLGEKDSRNKFAVAIKGLQHNAAWIKPHRVTCFIQLRRDRRLAKPKIKKIDRMLVLKELFNDSMVIFRREPFRNNRVFRRYSEFIFDLIVKLIQDVDVCRLEFADHDLSLLPALLDNI